MQDKFAGEHTQKGNVMRKSTMKKIIELQKQQIATYKEMADTQTQLASKLKEIIACKDEQISLLSQMVPLPRKTP